MWLVITHLQSPERVLRMFGNGPGKTVGAEQRDTNKQKYETGIKQKPSS